MRRRLVAVLLAGALTFTSMPVDQLTVWASEPVQEDLDDSVVIAASDENVSDEPDNMAEDAGMFVEADDPEVTDQTVQETAEGLIGDEMDETALEADAFTEDTFQEEDTTIDELGVSEDADGASEEEFEIQEDEEEATEEEFLYAASEEQLYAAENATDDAAKLEEALDNVLEPDGEPVDVIYNSDKWFHYFSYTPEETAEYTICSSLISGSIDNCVWLYRLTPEEMEADPFVMPEYISEDDEGNGNDNQFKLKYTLEKGYTYIFEMSRYNKPTSFSGNGTTSVSFEKTKALTGAVVTTEQISVFSGDSYYTDLELKLTYEDGADEKTVKGQDLYEYDGYKCVYAQGAYDEDIYIRFYQNEEQVNAPDSTNILKEAVYTVEPCVYGDDGLEPFTQSTLTVAMPSFEVLQAGSSVELTLYGGEEAYYKIAPTEALYASFWMEHDGYDDLPNHQGDDGLQCISDSVSGEC